MKYMKYMAHFGTKILCITQPEILLRALEFALPEDSGETS